MQKFLTVFAIAVFLALCVQQAESRSVQSSVSTEKFKRDRWYYITRFSCGVGRCSYTLKVKLTRSHAAEFGSQSHVRLAFVLYPFKSVESALQYEDIRERADKSYRKVYIDVPTDGSEAETITNQLFQGAQTRVYFFFLADPDNNLGGKTYPKSRLEVDFEMLNVDGSHFSMDEWGLKLPHLLISLLFAAFCGFNVKRLMHFYNKEQEMDWPFILLNAACFIEFLSLFMEWIHLVVLDYNGHGNFVPNFLSSVFSIVAQLTITSLLLLIATGWSINYTQVQDLDLVVVLGALLGFLHLIFVIFGHVFHDDPFKYHDYENWAGIVLVFAKIAFFGVFAFLLWNTYTKSDRQVKQFITQFGIIGSAYLLALPVIILIASTLVDNYSRHKTVTVGNILIQSIAVMLLAFLLTSKKSPYYSVSFKGKSGLPSLSGKMH